MGSPCWSHSRTGNWQKLSPVPATSQTSGHSSQSGPAVIIESNRRETEWQPRQILTAMGFRPSKEELMDILAEIDEDGSGEIEFAEFCQLCAKFLVEDPDVDTLKRELKDAFRIYDKDGQGFITMDTLRALIAELLSPLTEEELDGIIAELDEDGSGTMDFDEFCEMMMSQPEN